MQLDNPCGSNPCKNNGNCSNVGSLGKYICSCSSDCKNDLNCDVCVNQMTSTFTTSIISANSKTTTTAITFKTDSRVVTHYICRINT